MAEYSEHIKAQALALLLAGQSFGEVARQLNVPIGTLKSWKARNPIVLDAPDATGSTQKKERVGDLLMDYLITTLETLKAQQRVFADEEWLKQQSAESLAILHGVSFDKTVRLLEGLADDAKD